MVRSIAGPVPHDAKYRPSEPVVRHAGRHMRPVVLYLQEGKRQAFGVFLRFPCGKVVRMKITDQRGRRDAEQPEKGVQGLPIVVQSFQVF